MMVHHESSLYNVFKFEQDWIILLLKEGCPITLLYSDLIETGHTVLQGLLEYGAVKPDTPIFRKVQGSNSANLSREQISVSRKPRRTKHYRRSHARERIAQEICLKLEICLLNLSFEVK